MTPEAQEATKRVQGDTLGRGGTGWKVSTLRYDQEAAQVKVT